MRFGKRRQSEPIGLAQNGRPSLVRMLSLELQRPVLDKTGLKGIYNFSQEWTPDDRLGVEPLSLWQIRSSWDLTCSHQMSKRPQFKCLSWIMRSE